MAAYIPPITHNGELSSTFNSQDFESTYLDTFLPVSGGTITGALQVTGGIDNTGTISTTTLNATGSISSTELYTSSENIHLGNGSSSTNQGVSIGHNASGSGEAIAIGHNTSAGLDGVVVGHNSTGNGDSVVLGHRNTGGIDAVCIGHNAFSNGANSVALGRNCSTQNTTNSVAIGYSALCIDDNQIKIGTSASAYEMEGRLNLVNNTTDSLITFGNAVKLYRNTSGLTIGNYQEFAIDVDDTRTLTAVPAGRSGKNIFYANNQGRTYVGYSAGTMSLHLRSANSETYITGYTTAGNVSTIGTSGQLSVSSDRRLKENIIPYNEPSLSKLMKLKASYYNWIEGTDKRKELGFIAQDVETIIPEAVDGKKYEYEWKKDEKGEPILDDSGNLQFTDKPRYRGFCDRPVIAVLVKAVQEQQEQIEALKKEVEALKKIA